MKYKNTESKRTFVPKKIGDTLGKVNRSLSNKYGKTEFLILSKWAQIVGSFFAEHSEPDKISRLTEDFDEFDQPIFKNFLHVRVSPAAAVEFQHYKDTIIEKINSFFGYKCIKEIKLKIVHKKQKLEKIENSSLKTSSQYTKKLDSIQNQELKKSLNKLIKAYSK